ncbi:MAG: hypothetical protein K0A98_06850 [Trueperaceae bacterium]|nr:hypothetical protein [Trueperaceae bacterium]
MRNTFIVTASLALLLGACTREPLVVATADLEPKVRVVSTAGVGTEVTLVLFRDLLATYDLLPDERITAAPDGGTPVVMTPGVDGSSWLRRRAYVATLPEVGPRQDVVITFERPQYGEVLEIVARIPGEVTVTRPTAGEERTLNEPFAVAWDPLPGDQVEFRFDVTECDGLDAEQFADLRTEAAFAALPLTDGTLGLANLTFEAPDDATRCAADLLVGRAWDGEDMLVDEAFGELRGQSRSVRVSRVLPLTFVPETVLPTVDIAPKVRVVSVAGVGTEVTVVLSRAGLPLAAPYELAVGERLTATREGGAPVVLVPATDLSTPLQPDGYRAWLPELGPGERLTIALERAGDDAAPNTVVTIPAEFAPTAPAAGARLTFGEAFELAWDAVDDDLERRYVIAACAGLEPDEFEDVRVARGYPVVFAGEDGTLDLTFTRPGEAASCTLDLQVGRVGDGIALDPGFRELAAASRVVRVGAPLALTFEPAAEP